MSHIKQFSFIKYRLVYEKQEINSSKYREIHSSIEGDGEISFGEFVRVMGAQFYRKYTNEEIREAFAYFDRDNSGYISVDELNEVMSKMGRHYSKNELDRMVRAVDTDGNGRIEINEFTRLLNQRVHKSTGNYRLLHYLFVSFRIFSNLSCFFYSLIIP